MTLGGRDKYCWDDKEKVCTSLKLMPQGIVAQQEKEARSSEQHPIKLWSVFRILLQKPSQVTDSQKSYCRQASTNTNWMFYLCQIRLFFLIYCTMLIKLYQHCSMTRLQSLLSFLIPTVPTQIGPLPPFSNPNHPSLNCSSSLIPPFSPQIHTIHFLIPLDPL